MNALIVLVALPMLWSLLVHLARMAALQGRPALSDGAEKLILALMLLPIVAGAVVLLLAPMTRHLVPATVLMAPFHASGTGHGNVALARTASLTSDLAPALLTIFTAFYAAVALFLLGRLVVAYVKLAHVASTAMADGDVFRSPAPVPAFAWGRNRIVIPADLDDVLSAGDMVLIVAHERAHLLRRDPAWFLALSVIEAVLWFNPLIRIQGRASRLAAEIACDAAVIGHAPSHRHAYARVLLTALKHSVAAPAFLPAAADSQSYRHRLAHIMGSGSRPPKAVLWIAAVLILVVPVTAAQLAFAQASQAPADAAEPVAAPPVTTSPAFARPVDAPISSAFGYRPNPQPGERKNHIGIDFAAPLGTPVKAHASGQVSFAGHRDGYGETVEIDNGGDTTTRYAHLGSIDVKTGDTVSAGQVIADIGQPLSGAPHLHFELWHNHEIVDPTPLFSTNP